MPNKKLQGMTNNVRFSFSVNVNVRFTLHMRFINSIEQTSRIGDTNYNI